MYIPAESDLVVRVLKSRGIPREIGHAADCCLPVSGKLVAEGGYAD